MAKSQQVLETIDFLYQAAVNPSLWPEALHRFALAAGGVGTAMIPITPGSTAGLVLSPDLLESRAEYDREWFKHDSRVARIHSRKLKDGVCCEADLFTEEEIARDPLRQEFGRSYGMGSFAAHLVSPMRDFVVAFSVMRAVDRGQFEKRELQTLDLLGHHAARALLISMQLAGAERLRETLSNVLMQVQSGVFVIDRELRVLLANSAAEKMLGDGLNIQTGRLAAQSHDGQQALSRLLQSVLGPRPATSETGAVAIPRPSRSKPLLLQAIPVTPGSSEWSLPNGAAALIIAVDPETSEGRRPDAELRLLGLTRSEARIAALIGEGLSRAEAAEALGLSQSTVSDCLKDVYSKLDISRQSELVRLVGRLGAVAPSQIAADR